MADEDDPYRALGIAPGAEQEVIDAARNALLRKYHPDHFAGDPAEANARTRRINAAYARIATPEKRAARERRQRPASPAPTPPGRSRGDARVRVTGYFSRRRAEERPLGLAGMALIGATLLLVSLWAAEVLRNWRG